jgi:hypothetical protein
MMGSGNIRGVSTLAVCLLIASCALPGAKSPARPNPSATITFHNQGRDRIQVYLVGEKENWLIGRLEPLQTANLAIPQFGFASAPQAVALAVVPGWSRSQQPRLDGRATVSIDEVSDRLPGEEWIYVNGQLRGPLRAQSHGRF